MFAFLDRLISQASPAWRVLIALFASTPFYFLVIALYAWGLWDPAVRRNVNVEVVAFCILVFSLATLISLGVFCMLSPTEN